MSGPKSAFPQPPAFHKSFTASNIESLARLKREHDVVDDADWAAKLATAAVKVPEELTDLIPPAPPGPDEAWQVFGERKTFPPPELPFLPPHPPEPPVTQLHGLPPTPESIARLSRSALLLFLEIVNALARDPTPSQFYGPMWEDLRNIMVNAHRAVNLYRPWAARAQLIRILEAYAADARSEIAKVAELESRVDGLLADLAAPVPLLSSAHDAADETGKQGKPGLDALLSADRSSTKDATASQERPIIATPGDSSQKAIEEERRAWALVGSLGEQ